MNSIPFIDSSFIENNTNFNHLIQRLTIAFKEEKLIVPLRHHHDFPNPGLSDTTLLLMPAWDPGKEGGVKIISVCPENSKLNIPSIQGSYIYFDGKTGTIKAIFDAKKLTTKRTAAASALASSFLSLPSCKALLLIGTGALAPELIKAHASVRPIEQVYVWGRSREKAELICDQFENSKLQVESVSTIEEAMPKVDIISTATLSKIPLVFGDLLRPGQHIDLVGSYKPDMREADDEVIRRSSIFVDIMEGALKETGDIISPIESGIITPQDIRGDLFSMCKQNRSFRKFEDEITLFKSVGHALEDLVAAGYYYHNFIHA